MDELNYSQEETKVYTVKTVLEEYFQGCIGQTKLREMVRLGKIPHLRVGAKILFQKHVLDKWMVEQQDASIHSKPQGQKLKRQP